MTLAVGKFHSYPHPVLKPLPVDHAPNFPSLTLLQAQLNANASSVPYGIGQNLAVLTMTPAVYTTLHPDVAFVVPVHPGVAPVYTAGMPSAEFTSLTIVYNNQLAEFELYMSTDIALLAMIFAAVPDSFLTDLCDPILLYHGQTTLTVLNHLWTTYGTLLGPDMDANHATLVSAWNPNDPIISLFTRMKKCAIIAAQGEEPIPDRSLVRIGLKILQDSGLFAHGLNVWATFPAAERTFANFQIFFKARDIERRNDSTTGSLGYSNAVTTAPPAITQATHDANADVIRLTAELAIAKRAARGDEPPPISRRTQRAPFDYSTPPVHYCWTHGTGYNPRHTSATCNARTTNPLHKIEATLLNKLGGSNRVASYTPPATA
jgi:hypothetical protein